MKGTVKVDDKSSASVTTYNKSKQALARSSHGRKAAKPTAGNYRAFTRTISVNELLAVRVADRLGSEYKKR